MFEYDPSAYNSIYNGDGPVTLIDFYNEFEDDIKVRIKSIVLENFKSVKHGEVDFIEGHKPVNFSSEPGILGIYGQNGSGKTTLISALKLLQDVVRGSQLHNDMVSYIATDSESATIRTTFEIQIKGSEVVEHLTYEFSIKRGGNDTNARCKVYNEKITLKKINYDGKLIQKTRTLFDSNSRDPVKNGKKMKVEAVIPALPEKKPWIEEIDISDEREEAISKGTSIFFGSFSISVLDATVFGDDPYDDTKCGAALPGSDYDYILLIHEYMREKVMIAGVAALDAFKGGQIPFRYTRDKTVILNKNGFGTIDSEDEEYLRDCVTQLSVILRELVPGLGIHYEVVKTIKREKETGKEVYFKKTLAKVGGFAETLDDITSDEDQYDIEKRIRVFTERDGIRIPISQESEGIKRLIYELDILTEAFNDPGKMAVIDEFDAGIYEYLLGEILEIFEQYGMGQLVFTSHNLRPLEVLSRKYICFTTTNRNNRYIKLRNLGKTNNLRDVYLRAIFADDLDEKLYERKKDFQIADAFRRAGMAR